MIIAAQSSDGLVEQIGDADTIDDVPVDADPEGRRSFPHRPSVYPLQPIASVKPTLSAELYRRSTEFWDVVEREDGLFLDKFCWVDFNAFVNVFFEWHWLRCTGSSADALELEVEGAGEVHVTRTLRDGRSERIATQRVETGRSVIAIPPPSLSPGTLSFAAGTRDDAGLIIKNAVWSTSMPPRQNVVVDIVICTFNKLAMLRPSLDALCRSGLPTPGIGRIIVVDQGTDRLTADCTLGEATRNAIASERLLIIEQPNLGGAGGFTRGIVESVSEEGFADCTHVLLMDDDVLFEPRLLPRLVAFLSRLPKEAVVGGSMLDMMRPHHMFAYAERFNVRTGHCEQLEPSGLDLHKSQDILRLEDASTGNYNGWFICCFPRSVFEKHGFPLPMFVRSDDCEFGLRLTNRGVPLIHMPALFVWHEPFWLKRRAWIEVYTLRNHLIVANTACDRYNWLLAIRRLGEFWYYISTYQYNIAFACCLAIENYLEGPEAIFGNTIDQHKKIDTRMSVFEDELRRSHAVVRSSLCPRRGAVSRSRCHSMLPQVVGWLSNIAWNLWGRSVRSSVYVEADQAVPQDRLYWRAFHKFPVVLIDVADGHSSVALFHEPAIARRLTVRMLKVIGRLLWSGSRRRVEYREAVRTFGSKAHWQDTFAALPKG